MTPVEWLSQLEEVHTKHVKAGWHFVNILLAGVDSFGMYVLGEAAEHLNVEPKTLQNYLSVARSPVAPLAIELGLSIAHCQAVVGLPDEEARTLLTVAAERGESSGWLRHEARKAKGVAEVMNALKAIGSAPLNDNRFKVETHTGSTLTSIDDGGTQHRRHGVDPFPGVAVVDCEMVDDVPFADPVFEWPNDATPFDIAEQIVLSFGQPFAVKVAEEVTRWSKWQ